MSPRIHSSHSYAVILVALTAVLVAPISFTADSTKGTDMTHQANGTFEVKMTPQAEDKTEGAALGRMSLQKTFSGDLEGTSQGEMLTAMGTVEGSAVYVAIERVKGALQGKRGTFALSHRGTMTRGAQQLTIDIVPDSGSGEFVGIAGSMTIKIEAGKHFYVLTYTLPR